MPDELPRVFLSYGVHDASELAERLRLDLTARGYHVWQDVNRIRASRPWDEEVQTGLRNSQVVLALLSPQSVRRALDAGNPTATDSVCLNEIEYAQRACKIPIVPVQVISCEAPFLIYRLHQINFRYWRESEATYQAGLNQICAAIAEAIQSRKSPERSWTPSLEPWDFAPFLLEKRNHFTGRQWLFRDLDEWRSKQAPPALLITGEPGIGKSAIVAALVDNNPDGQVLAYHCCRADTPATLEPARFVRSLAGMLAARLEGYAAMLENPGIKDVLERVDSDPASAFEAAVLSPMHSVSRTAGDRRYLLIDALDEALMHPKRPTIVEVLAARINRLPPWLGIVATTRSEPGVLSQLRGLPAQALKADDPKNQDDVLAFLEDRLSEPSLRNKVEASDKTLEDVAMEFLRSSAGNFLFVTTAIDAVEGGQLRFDDLENQPPGRLSSLYEVFFNRLFRDAGMDFQPAGQVLEVVAAAREPPSRKQIATVTGLDAEKELPPLLGRLAAFVPVREGCYSLFHRSLFEWLTGWDTQQDQSFAGHYHLSLQEGHKRLADWGWSEYEHGITKEHLYCLRHLPTHLAEVGRDGDLRTLLLNFNWLQKKLEATDTNALIADYDYLPNEADLQLVQSAIRLSANVLARDARQLSGQLIGRLLSNTSPSIQALLKQAAERKVWPWLQPLNRSLTAPGGPLMRILEGHTDRIWAVAITPDGGCVVSGGRDQMLMVWDLESGETIRSLAGHTNDIRAVAVTPDGRYAISGSDDNTLRVWDLESWEILRLLQGHTKGVLAVAVTPDGRCAVSGSYDGTLRVWQLENGQLIHTLQAHTDGVGAVTVTPDSRYVVFGVSETLRVWDLKTDQPLHVLRGHTAGVWAAAIMPDGRHAVSGSADRTLRVWDLESGQTVRTFEGHNAQVDAVAVMSDGKRIISGSHDRTVRIWNLESGQMECTLQGHTRTVSSLAITPDGCRIVSASWDKTLRIWDVENSQIIRAREGNIARGAGRSVTHPRGDAPCQRRSSGRRQAGASHIGTLEDVDQFMAVVEALEHRTGSVQAVGITPDGHRAISGSTDGALHVWDLKTGQTVRTIQAHTGRVRVVAVMPNGWYAISGSADKTLRVWDLESGKMVRVLDGHTGSVRAVAILRDGRRAVSASEDGTLRVWDLQSGETLRILYSDTASVNAVAVTADGHRAVSVSGDLQNFWTERVWDLDSGKAVREFRCHPKQWGVAVASDLYAISAGHDGILRVWDLESDKMVRWLEGHTDSVINVATTPDGRRAVSASADRTVRVWDLQSGSQIAAFVGEGFMLSCAISADGRTIVAGDELGRVHFLQIVEANKTKPSIAKPRSGS